MRKTEDAIRAACALVRELGQEPDRCEVLQDGSTLVLRLGASLVARVVQDTSGPRRGLDWFLRENAVAIFLAGRGAPVIPLHPVIPPGPHEREGFPMNFWSFVEKTGREPAAEEAGRTLAECHRLLAGYEGDLPRLGIVTEALRVLEGGTWEAADRRMLRHHLERGLDLEGAFQPLHGDAHPGNILDTTGGALWTDWEDSFQGPVEWDLSSLLWNARHLEGELAWVGRVLAGYRAAGGTWDEGRLEDCDRVRAAVMTAWYPVLYPDLAGDRHRKLEFRLEWLRARA